MCDFSRKLVAFLDQELGENEMVDVQQHVQDCVECRRQLDAFQQMSVAVNAYCEAVIASKSHRGTTPLGAVLSGVVAVAVAAALVLAYFHKRVEPLIPRPAAAIARPPVVLEAARPPINTPPRRHPVALPPVPNTYWALPEPAIHVAIPADSIFPPGALPEGINFTADLSIAADGSAQQVSLQPRLIGFQRRATQP